MEKIIASILTLAFTILLISYPLMWLWNWLMPEIFGLIKISFWQALGLNALATILIKDTNNSSK